MFILECFLLGPTNKNGAMPEKHGPWNSTKLTVLILRSIFSVTTQSILIILLYKKTKCVDWDPPDYRGKRLSSRFTESLPGLSFWGISNTLLANSEVVSCVTDGSGAPWMRLWQFLKISKHRCWVMIFLFIFWRLSFRHCFFARCKQKYVKFNWFRSFTGRSFNQWQQATYDQ